MSNLSPICSNREGKPTWQDVPEVLKEEISALLGAKVVYGEIAWGGYSPSASYIISLANGQKYFVKGTHPEQMSHGAKMLDQEIEAYQNLDFLQKFCPSYYGSVSVGGEDDWYLGIWQYIEDSQPILPWTGNKVEAVISHLALLHTYYKEDQPQNILTAEQTNFVSMFIKGHNGWDRLKTETKFQKRFIDLFTENETQAQLWFEKTQPLLLDQLNKISKVKCPKGLLHFDLRSDNILYHPSKETLFLDWPNVCWGPVLLDLAHFLPSITAEGGETCSKLFQLYLNKTGFDLDEKETLPFIASLSAYYAMNAFRLVPDKLPRLRIMQKKTLFALLCWASDLLNVQRPPPISV